MITCMTRLVLKTRLVAWVISVAVRSGAAVLHNDGVYVDLLPVVYSSEGDDWYRRTGRLSPVIEDTSTFKPLQAIIRTSAGT
jgi:hypothetical protein